jgi:diguanylate cyclase (GGDEF)-like protein
VTAVGAIRTDGTGDPRDGSAHLAARAGTGMPGATADDALQRLARTAAQLCAAPIALISLVDGDRQWCAAMVGLDADAATDAVAGVVPDMVAFAGEDGFCNEAFEPNAPVVVVDVLADARFGDDPFVVAHGIHAAAGVPLVVDGQRVGVLCVLDRVPRPFGADQIDGLEAIGAAVSALVQAGSERRRTRAGAEETARVLEDAGALTQRIIAASPDPVLRSSGGTISHANASAVALFGSVGDPLEGVVSPSDRARLRADLARSGIDGEPVGPVEYRVVGSLGHERTIEAVHVGCVEADATVTYTFARDVTVSRREALLHAAQAAALELVARDAPLAESLEVIVSSLEEILGGGARCSILLLEDGTRLRHGAAPSLPLEYTTAIDGVEIGPSVGSCGTAAWRAEPVIVADIATDPLWAGYRDYALPHGLVSCWSMPVLGAQGQVLATFAVYRPVVCLPLPEEWDAVARSASLTAVAIGRSEASAALRHQATHDDLTGLPNRTVLLERIEAAVAGLRQAGSDRTAAVLFVDLDDFKLINDTYGHGTGDRVLRGIAAALRSAVRETDTVGRFSGDEFVIVCPSLKGRRGLDALVERIRTAMAMPFVDDGAELRVVASVGVALTTNPEASASLLLAEADAAMYRAKEQGRGEAVVFSDDLRRAARRRLAIEHGLRVAFEHDDIRLHYQPEVELATGRVVAVEALARWEHPELGPVPPSEFVAVAQRCGLGAQLTQRVLRQACDQIRTLVEHFGADAPVVAVNLSARELVDRRFVTTVAQTVRRARIDPRLLCVEVTESDVMHDPGAAAVTMEALRHLGVRFAIDDFGTGYSSLAYLKRLPADYLKIDRSFIDGVASDHDDRAIVRAVLALADAVGLDVIAEGVEDADQLAELMALGCRYGQGFLWSPPVAAEDLVALLAAGVGAVGMRPIARVATSA